MRFLKALLVIVIILAAFFVGGAYLLPDEIRVERATVIQADASRIFPYLTNYRRFNEWSPWMERDPNAKYTFSGPEEGVGAKMAWQSDNEEVGSGSQEIIEVVPDERVVTALDFGEMGQAQAAFQLQPADGGTKVTWSLESTLPANPMARWMGLILDGMIGADYEEGLKRLKAKVENGSV